LGQQFPVPKFLSSVPLKAVKENDLIPNNQNYIGVFAEYAE
jgi:hypothetical protein